MGQPSRQGCISAPSVNLTMRTVSESKYAALGPPPLISHCREDTSRGKDQTEDNDENMVAGQSPGPGEKHQI